MKRLSKALLNQINDYMSTEARPLEKAIFNYYFNDSTADNILSELAIYQNSDGGFGQGIEPDFKLLQSSAMATSIGLRHLCKIDNCERSQKMISRAIEYLENTFDSDRNGWYSVPSNDNNYPHASWWEFRHDMNMTAIDYSWGNPTAELIGYLYKYKRYINNLDVNSLLDYAMINFNNYTEFNSEHEIFCYIQMYNSIDEKSSTQIIEKLKLAVSELVNINKSEWTNYVPTPLKFVDFDSSNYFDIDDKYVDENLDYLIDCLERHGKIIPTWEWDKYLDEWEIARREWMGILTLEALLSLLKFNRIERN